MRILACVLIACMSLSAQTLTLLTPVSSKMPTGTAFQAKDESSGKIYEGYIVSRPAMRFSRRGSLVLRFADPVRTVDNGHEGVIKASRKKQLIVLGSMPLVAKVVDDSVDGIVGPNKSRYVALGSLAFMALFKGGEVNLKPGYKVVVEAEVHGAKSPAKSSSLKGIPPGD